MFHATPPYSLLWLTNTKDSLFANPLKPSFYMGNELEPDYTHM
jgi:hypothetical protein